MLQRLDHYEILERMEGGFVYQARDSRNGTLVAIKLHPAWLTDDLELTGRFEREIKVEQAIRHPNVASLLDIGSTQVTDPELTGSNEEATVIYMVKEYVEGESVRAFLDRGLPLLPTTLDIAIQVTRGLEVLHEHGIVHRNVNPESMRIRPDGQVKLVDFGLVKIVGDQIPTPEFQTALGRPVGTTPYLAPEQVRAEEVDAPTDLFGLGVLLYEMLTGELPFPIRNLIMYYEAVQHGSPRPMTELRGDLPPELVGLVDKLLAKDMADRYQRAARVESELAAVRSRLGTPG